MDPIIQNRLKTTIMVHPYEAIVGGDKKYGEPYPLNAYITYREKVVLTPLGSEFQIYTYLIFDGEQPTPTIADQIVGFIDINNNELPITLHPAGAALAKGNYENLFTLGGIFRLKSGRLVQFALIKSEDEIELSGQGRIPVKTVKAYQGLCTGTQSVEVIL